MANGGTLNSFINKFKDGFVHPNLFRIKFSGNDVVTKYGEMLSAACKSAQIPGVTFTEAMYYHEGFNHKFVSGADYDAFPLTFMVDGGGSNSEIIDCFDEWSALIFNDGKFGFKEKYEANLEYEILNRDGTNLYKSKLIGVYPVNIAPFDLSFESADTIMEYEISFNFLKFDN